MKEITIVVFVILLLVISTAISQAATPTPIKSEPTPSTAQAKQIPSDSLTEEITNLKEKIASRVAELRLVEKRGIIGIANEVKGTQITLTDVKGKTRFVDVDELTKFTGSDSKSSFGISDIKKGMKLTVLGRYNKQTERILARFVRQVTIPEFLSGTIKSIDSTNFALVVEDKKGKSTTLDVESVTRTQSYTKEDGISRSGFSRLEVGDHIVVSGFPDKNDESRLVATRILALLDFRPESAEDTATPSPTASTKKIATPTPEE